MIVTLNGYPINDNSNGAYLDTELDGLDLPDIRTSSGNYSGRNGGFVGAQFYGPRTIAINGTVFASDIGTLETTRKALQAALQGSGGITMQIQTNAGGQYILYAYLIDFDMPIKANLFSAPFQIQLRAPDPTIYDNSVGAISVNVPKLTSGGYIYPVVYPVVYSPGSSPTIVPNSGNVAVYPTVTINGSATNPVISDTTSGAFLGLNVTTGPSDQIVIDMRQRTVLLNGGSIFADLATGSSFFSLQPGANSMTLKTSSGTDTAAAIVAYRPGVLGI